MTGAAIGGLALLGGDAWPAWVAVFGFGITTLYALQVPKTVVAKKPASAHEITELKTESIVYTAATMAFLRAAVGFVTFLLAFEFRGGDEGLSLSGIGEAAGVATGHLRNQDVFGTPGAPAWHFGVVMVAAGLGMLIGANLAPRMRKRFIEERIIFLALLLLFTGAITAAFALGVLAAVLISFVTTIAGGTAKLAFDSLVQRDAPDANHGRFFAKFEGRFQMSWAVGALKGLLPTRPPRAAAALPPAWRGVAPLVARLPAACVPPATFRAAIAPGPTLCRTVVHDQATVLAYVAPGV